MGFILKPRPMEPWKVLDEGVAGNHDFAVPPPRALFTAFCRRDSFGRYRCRLNGVPGSAHPPAATGPESAATDPATLNPKHLPHALGRRPKASRDHHSGQSWQPETPCGQASSASFPLVVGTAVISFRFNSTTWW